MIQVRRFFSFAIAGSTAIWLLGCQTTGSIGNPSDHAIDSRRMQTTIYMPVGQQVTPPYGYIGFCLHDPKECEGGTDKPKSMELTPARWTEINQVNDFVNTSIPQVEDQANYGVAEYWGYPNERGGDCEDLALLKRKMLIERGWAPEDVLITVVREWNGDGHAVLVVSTDKGDYVLDNKNWAIVSWADAPYTWVKRQSRERPYIWVNADPGSFSLASNDTLPPLGTLPPFIAAAQKKEPQKTAALPTPENDPSAARSSTAALTY